MQRVRKLPQAGAEADAAAEWYETRKPGLGGDFLDEVDRAVAIIVQNPLRNAVRFGDVRRAAVHRFESYGVYYFVQGEEIVIISVFSDKQDPQRLRLRRKRAP